MKSKVGRHRYTALVFGNILIAVFILVLCVDYAQNVRSDKEGAARESFTAAVESTSQLSYGYMRSLQNECDSWASYLENHGYSMEESIEYLKEVNINDNVSVHILYYDTLSGLSTDAGTEGNSVDYSHVAEAFTYILPQMVNGSRGEGAIYISSAYINPADGVNSVGFCSLLTLKDENGENAKAILVKTIPVEILHSQWLFPGAYRDAEVSLIDINGRYIIRSDSMSGDTFWTFIKQNNELSYVDIGEFQSEFQKRDSYLVELKDQAGEAAYYVSARISNTPNCTFVGYIQSGALVNMGFDWHMLLYVTAGFFLILLLDGGSILYINSQLRKSIEETRRANMAKTQFLSSMSHDIRTPMNAIIGMTAIATKHIEDRAQVLDCLNKIVLAGNHLLTLVNDVLDISKVESGKMALRPVVFSLSELSANLVNIVRPQIKEKGLDFDVRLHHLNYEYLYADELRVNQIFINLLTNAVKYTNPGGSIVLELGEEPLPEDGSKVVLTYMVRDTGIGMSQEFMKNMYRTFTRAVDSRIDKVQGTGLGLAITRQMVELMHGTIDCESELGKGTKFTVRLTLSIAERITDDLMLPPIRLLLVDDDEVFLETAEDMLVSMGVKVDIAVNGRTAVEMAAAGHESGQDYPVVIVDLMMPDMDGIETTRAIRARIGDEVPIIIISAYDWTEMEDAAKEAGANGFINKPMFKSAVYEKMNEFLHFSEVETEAPDDSADGLQGLHLLIAEDNDLNWEIIEALLKFHDIDSVRAGNGQICVDILNRSKAGTYDAVLMDIQMPVMDGREAAMAIRSFRDKKKREIPIIAMTADAFAEDIQSCLEAGMNAHIAKPIDMKKLLRELRNAGLADKAGR
ncbi:hybrid sensor histidine kinase/response regulator [Clostridium transplantifaecale]|uniref:hybrid sensor histidine kinase/response regulator n=1 Tax=Clostridium transplantifaecale TaxID=2479838 RepID=UPI000F63A9DE|nr:response regulator [Clostridium transplantifaecale]